VLREGRSLTPTAKGRILSTFLETFFARWVDYGYTSDMEAALDSVSAGNARFRAILDDFWRELTASVDRVVDVEVSDVLAALEQHIALALFPPRDDGRDSQTCPVCGSGTLHLKLSRAGGFVGCSNYRRSDEELASCTYVRPLSFSEDYSDVAQVLLGVHPQLGNPVHLRTGPYGWCAG